MTHDQAQATQRIRALNDTFRTTLQGGRFMITSGVQALGPEAVATLIQRVRTFSQFDQDNDPYEEHDFGAFDHEGQKYFWKIDYYDPSLNYHSDDASDPKGTVRVLTLMRAEEY
jgi:hypothetical protein